MTNLADMAAMKASNEGIHVFRVHLRFTTEQWTLQLQ